MGDRDRTNDLVLASLGVLDRSKITGLFIIDTFAYTDDQPRHAPAEAIGGGGCFAVLGCRLYNLSAKMIVDRGDDFDQVWRHTLDQIPDTFVYRDNTGQPTAKSINTFSGQHRDFAYLTARRQIEVSDLQGFGLWPPKYLHAICSPERLLEHYAAARASGHTPKMVYEPIPWCCEPSQLEKIKSILPFVDVFSPNHEEAASLLEMPSSDTALDKGCIEVMLTKLFDYGAKDIVIIRCGAAGCCANSRARTESGKTCAWIPAYHREAQQVVDPTGGGNSFLGGFVAGLYRSDGDLIESLLYGSIAASFIIEQYGLPEVSSGSGGLLWNGKEPDLRLREWRKALIAQKLLPVLD